jgi:hypothetical protein
MDNEKTAWLFFLFRQIKIFLGHQKTGLSYTVGNLIHVIQRGHSPFVRIALPSSLMLWLEVVPSDGIGILPLICEIFLKPTIDLLRPRSNVRPSHTVHDQSISLATPT